MLLISLNKPVKNVEHKTIQKTTFSGFIRDRIGSYGFAHVINEDGGAHIFTLLAPLSTKLIIINPSSRKRR